MKKLIFLLLIGMCGICYADSNTTDDPKLLLISTSSRDTTKSWGDKNNENMILISTTIANVKNSIASSTSNFNSRFENVAVATKTIGTRLDNVAISTGILSNSTATLGIRLDNVAVSTGILSNSTSTLSTRLDNVAVSTGILSNSTATIATRQDAIAVSTGNIKNSTLTWTATQTWIGTTTFKNSVFIDSMTAFGTITSTSAFAVNVASINYLQLMQATMTIRGNNYIWQSTAPSDGILHIEGNRIFSGLDSGGGGGLTSAPTDYAIFGLLISSIGTDTNQMQSTITFINIMGDVYYNVVTTFSLAVSGIGGLDTGSEATTKWYGIWAISRNNNTAMNIVLSDAGNIQPVLPTGYTKWRRIGWVYNDGSSNIVPFMKRDKIVTPWVQQLFLNTAPPATSVTALSMIPYISTTAVYATVALWSDNSLSNVKIFMRQKGTINFNSSFGNMDQDQLTGGNVEIMIPLYNNPQSWEYYSAGTYGEFYSNLRSYMEE